MNGTTWEEETQARWREAQEHRKQAEADAAYWGELADALEKSLVLVRQKRSIQIDGDNAIDPELLRTKSIRLGLMEIAAHNNSTLLTKDAIDVMVQAQVFKDKEAARGTVYSTVGHSKRYFQKLRPGVYALTDYAKRQLRTASITSGR